MSSAPTAVTQRALSLLTDNPSGNELARAIAIDFLLEFNVTKVRISGARSDDSLIFLGDYGFTPSTTNQTEAAEVWRKRDDEIRHVKLDQHYIGFNDARTCAAAQLKVRGVTCGVLAIYFATPLTPARADSVKEIVLELIAPLSLFLFVRPNIPSLVVAGSGFNTSSEVSLSQFSERQLKILQQMATGRTNHEIATALGFSVSTIRHETMRIFQILGVSDRQEAASKARSLGILQSA